MEKYRAQQDAPMVITGRQVIRNRRFNVMKSPIFDMKEKNLFSGLIFMALPPLT